MSKPQRTILVKIHLFTILDKDIDRAIILHQGDSIPGFPSIDAFLYN